MDYGKIHGTIGSKTINPKKSGHLGSIQQEGAEEYQKNTLVFQMEHAQ